MKMSQQNWANQRSVKVNERFISGKFLETVRLSYYSVSCADKVKLLLSRVTSRTESLFKRYVDKG